MPTPAEQAKQSPVVPVAWSTSNGRAGLKRGNFQLRAIAKKAFDHKLFECFVKTRDGDVFGDTRYSPLPLLLDEFGVCAGVMGWPTGVGCYPRVRLA